MGDLLGSSGSAQAAGSRGWPSHPVGATVTAHLAWGAWGQTPSAAAGWMLDLYVGNPPSFPIGACTLPYQLGPPS